MQMKSISETKRKLEQSKVDLGENSNQENCVYFKEIAERVMTRTMSNLLNYDRCLKSFHVKRAGDVSLKEWSNVIVDIWYDFIQQIINEIKDRFQELCRPQ